MAEKQLLPPVENQRAMKLYNAYAIERAQEGKEVISYPEWVIENMFEAGYKETKGSGEARERMKK